MTAVTPSRGAGSLQRSAPTWRPRAVTLTDQVLSSVSNLLAVVLVARALSAADFGRFSLGYAILTLTLGLSRSFFGTRVALAPDAVSARRVTGELVGAMIVLAPVAALAVLAVSALTTGGASLPLLALVACATPIVCVQDILRFGAAASGRPWAALVSDGIWVLVMTAPFALHARLSPTSTMTLWMGAAVLALVLVATVLGEPPRLRAGVARLRERHPVGESVTVGTVLVAMASLWVLLFVARALGPSAAGSLRGASTTMGPVNVLVAFCGLGLTPALVRRRRGGDLRFTAATGAVMAVLTLGWGLLLLLLPDAAGTAAFGRSWHGIRSVLPWTTLEYVFLCLSTAALLGLKVRLQARAIIRQRAVLATATVLGGMDAALVVHDARAVAAMLAAASVLAAGVGWYQLSRPWRAGPEQSREVALAAELSPRPEVVPSPTPVDRRALVGYTAGIFDVFHVGHLNLLRHARERCDFLIAGVTVDDLAEQVRGSRPLIPLIERLAIVQSVRYVDQVVPQESRDKILAWNTLKFDVLFVGDNVRSTADWDTVEESLRAVGADVVYLPATYVRSEELLRRGMPHLVSD